MSILKRLSFCILFLLIISENLLSENRGVYIWTQTFYPLGIQKTIQNLKESKITDIYLLVKGEAGFTVFPSEYSYKDHYRTHADSSDEAVRNEYHFMSDSLLVNKIINEAHKNGIRVHAWFIISGDKHFVEKNPGSEVVQLMDPAKTNVLHPVIDKGHVNLANPSYKKYIFSLIEKALEYPFDGLMLDKIRYTSLTYTFDDIHISKALRAGIDMNKVIRYAAQSSYGNEDEKYAFAEMYRDGDKDIKGWIEIKKQDILEYVQQCRDLTNKKDLILSASFMPEGAYDDVFSDIYYAQNFSELSDYLDYIVIMAYPKAFEQSAAWIKMVTANAKEKSSCPIWIAIQGYDNVTAEFVYDQVICSRVVNSDGIAVFRLGGMNDEMWKSFNKAMDADITKIIKEQRTGVIYSGKGTIANSAVKSAEALFNAGNIIPLINEYKFEDEELFNKIDFILIPGGSATSIAVSLGSKSLNNIGNFVASGGGYIGICAGAYLPVKGFNESTSSLQIVNAEVKDVEHWNRGTGPVQIEIIKDHPLFKSIEGKTFQMNYFNGPVLIPAGLKLPAFKTLAAFKSDYHENGAKEGDMINSAAIIEAKYKKGKVLLFSPHPELTPGGEKMLADAVLYVSKP